MSFELVNDQTYGDGHGHTEDCAKPALEALPYKEPPCAYVLATSRAVIGGSRQAISPNRLLNDLQ